MIKLWDQFKFGENETKSLLTVLPRRPFIERRNSEIRTSVATDLPKLVRVRHVPYSCQVANTELRATRSSGRKGYP